MIKAEYEILKETYPNAMNVWKDRMMDMSQGDMLDQMIECMEGPLLSKILIRVEFDILESRENDND